ncbi:head-tail joining protein [Comamonas terrigena]|uniref:head-tail joining protein n=1 Tax=Comamonas terrigena TaxID=32013 RepID=UPI0028ADF55E|nr:hypothetical protein [Comamonas terrigena]
MASPVIAPFAARQKRLNAAVQRRLADAVAVWRGGDPFGVLLDQGSHEAFGDVAVGEVVCNLPLTCAPGLARGDELVIDGVPYEVAAPVQPDASGWVALQLRKLDGGASHG